MTNAEARRFLLIRHGLMGPKRLGKSGVMEYIRSVGSIQFDPVDVCGRNPEIILQSRIKNFTKETLYELLYKDRALVDFFDKNLCIFPIEDWPYLVPEPSPCGYAAAYDSHGGDAVEKMKPLIRKAIGEKGCVSASEITVDDNIVWHWGSMASLPRVALESMYFRGELIIHHKKGAIKSYAFAEDHIPDNLRTAPYPFKDKGERDKWIVARRIGAIGMLLNRSGDAWLGYSINAAERAAAFKALLDECVIFEVNVDGFKNPLYIRETERPILERALREDRHRKRAEFIAPLDCFLWDRRLIEAIFGFHYMWEIYTPAKDRKYGPYSLPFLWGDVLAGRADMERKGNILAVKRFWTEVNVKFSGRLKKDFEECAERFAVFNGCSGVEYLF